MFLHCLNNSVQINLKILWSKNKEKLCTYEKKCFFDWLLQIALNFVKQTVECIFYKVFELVKYK